MSQQLHIQRNQTEARTTDIFPGHLTLTFSLDNDIRCKMGSAKRTSF